MHSVHARTCLTCAREVRGCMEITCINIKIIHHKPHLPKCMAPHPLDRTHHRLLYMYPASRMKPSSTCVYHLHLFQPENWYCWTWGGRGIDLCRLVRVEFGSAGGWDGVSQDKVLVGWNADTAEYDAAWVVDCTYVFPVDFVPLYFCSLYHAWRCTSR